MFSPCPASPSLDCPSNRRRRSPPPRPRRASAAHPKPQIRRLQHRFRPPTPPEEHLEFTQNGHPQTADGRILIEAADGGILLQTNDGRSGRSTAPTSTNAETRRAFKPLTPPSPRRATRLRNAAPASAATTRRTTSSFTTRRARTPSGPARYSNGCTKRSPIIGKGRASSSTNPSSRFPSSSSPRGKNTTRPAAKTCPAAPATSSASTVCGRTASTCSTSPAAKPSRSKTAPPRTAAARCDEINQMLSQPAATPLVATVVHEATHQIAFNCGMQTTLRRYPALALRRHGRLLRSARPRQHPAAGKASAA